MNPKLLQQVIDAIEKGDGQAALDLLKQALVDAASGGVEQDPAPGGPGNAPGVAAKDPAAPGAGDVPPAVAGGAEYKAMRKRLDELEARDAARDLDDKRAAIVELVACGAETPATAWVTREADPAKGLTAITASDRVPVERLAKESAASMLERVVALKKLGRPAPEPPEGGAHRESAAASLADEVARLTAQQIEAAKSRGLTPEAFVIARRGAIRPQIKGVK